MGNSLMSQRYEVSGCSAASLAILRSYRIFLRMSGRSEHHDGEFAFDYLSQRNIPLPRVDDNQAIYAFAFRQIQVGVAVSGVFNGFHQ